MRELTPELRALHDLARTAAQGTCEVEDLLRRICTSVVRNFGFERATISHYVPERNAVVPMVACGLPEEDLPELVPLDDQPLLQRALAAGEPVFVEDVRRERALSDDLIEAFGVRSLLAVPLMAEGRCVGFLGADRGGKLFRLDEATLDVLGTIGAFTAVFFERAIEHRELQRLDELKTNFIALASHELRTPTAVIHGIAATLCLRGDALTDEQQHTLRGTLYEQTERLRRLIDQLLDLSRLEADRVEISPERFPVHRRVEELVRAQAGERVRDIRIDMPRELETVADPHAFDRIVSNLITNAFKYGEPPVIVSARQSDSHFRLAVEDRGRGVPPEFVPELFQSFTRSEPEATKAEGAGLGLSIAQCYAAAHGGEILYENANPRGARFELVLPARR